MIRYVTGDLLKADAEVLVNTVNCVGVMGKGIALQFKRAFPDNFKSYKKACESGVLAPGRIHIVETGRALNPQYIINFPTKQHWKEESKLEYIETGLVELVKFLKDNKIKSVAIPPLGCGNGGLDWSVVKKLIESALSSLGTDILVFRPLGAPAAGSMQTTSSKPGMTTARASVLKLIEIYLRGGYEATFLVVQKLGYFLQSSGQDLRLQYSKGQYGPYAANLNQLLLTLEGHWITGVGDLSGDKGTEIQLMPESHTNSAEFLKSDYTTLGRIDHVAELISGFETPYGLELLSTVHWVVNQESASTIREATEAVQEWNKRKAKLFGDDDIRIAWERLREKGWIQ